jgi:putative acetyltransferase
MVKATDDSSLSIPLVSRITSLSVSVALVISSVVVRLAEWPCARPAGPSPRSPAGLATKGQEQQPMSVTVAVESPSQDDVRALIAELNATLLELTPPEFVFHMTAEQMAEPDTTVFIAREDGEAVACGALKRHANGVGEVKRMYTRPSHRGRKIGAMIVERIDTLARSEGLERLVLETGDRHPAAWTVYERAGFTRCGPVLDYPDSKWSVFYEKNLIPSGRRSP